MNEPVMIWKHRADAGMPYQEWRPFPPDAYVEVANVDGQTRIARADELWWGYEQEMGRTADGVIVRARRLDQ